MDTARSKKSTASTARFSEDVEQQTLLSAADPLAARVLDALPTEDLAARCAAALRRHGVCRAPEDWLVLESTGDRHCWSVLSELAATEKLTAVQIARLRLALRRAPVAASLAAPPEARPPPEDVAPAVALDPASTKRPFWRLFSAYTLPNPLKAASP